MKYINTSESKSGTITIHTDKEGQIVRVDVLTRCKTMLMQLGYKRGEKAVISLCEPFTLPSVKTLYTQNKLKTFALMIFMSYDEISDEVLSQGFELKEGDKK